MKVIAFAGVSGTGKTSLLNKLEEMLDGRLESVPEATRGEVFNWNNSPVFDLKKASQEQLRAYDIGRLEYQLQYEARIINKSKKEIIIFDKAAPVALMYMLLLSSRSICENDIGHFVSMVKDHAKRYYDEIYYFPVSALCNVSNSSVNRNFTNYSVLNLMDAALARVLKWMSVKVTTLHSSDKRERANIIVNSCCEEVCTH